MFWILHLLACLFGFVWLLITIPLHMIYRAIKGQSGSPVNEKEKDSEGFVINKNTKREE